MGENILKEPELPVEPVVEKPVRKRSNKAAKFFKSINVFGVFDRNQIVREMPFILFITVLIIVYIGNSYYAEKMIREIDKTKTSLKERREEFIFTESELMNISRQSQVAQALEASGIRETTEPPRIIIKGENKNTKN